MTLQAEKGAEILQEGRQGGVMPRLELIYLTAAKRP